jgi:outer membrane protein assembly factor BamB
LYKYDPATNRVVGAWDIPLWDDMYSTLCVLDNNTLVGYCGDTIFLFDLLTGKIIWKEVTGRGQKIYSITVAPDNSVYIAHMYLSPLDFKIVRYNFDVTDRANIKAASALITILSDQDQNERSKPTGMLAVQNTAAGNYDLYISGLFSLYRIKV